MADYYEAVVAAGADAKLAANWITGDIAAHVNSNRLGYADLPFRPEQLAEMVQLIDGGKISGKIAKEILPELLEKGGSPKAIVDERGLGMISDPAAITAIVEELLAAGHLVHGTHRRMGGTSSCTPMDGWRATSLENEKAGPGRIHPAIHLPVLCGCFRHLERCVGHFRRDVDEHHDRGSTD